MQIYKCDVKGCTYTAPDRSYFKHFDVSSIADHELAVDLQERDICPECAVRIMNMIESQFCVTDGKNSVSESVKEKTRTVKKADAPKKSNTKQSPHVLAKDLAKSMFEDYTTGGMSQKEIAIKYSKSQSVVSRMISSIRAETQVKPCEDKTQPAEKDVKDTAVKQTVNSKKVVKVTSNESCRKGANPKILMAYIDHTLNDTSYHVCELRYEVPEDQIINVINNETSKYDAALSNIVKLYESGVPVKALSRKYRIDQTSIITVLQKRAKQCYFRKDVDPNSPVYKHNGPGGLDAPGVLALYHAGWLITDICDEKNYTLADVISMLNTEL